MKYLFALVTIVVAVNALSDVEKWSSFKKKYPKSYKNVVEETYRFKVFQSNLRTIEAHNARYENGQETFYMGINKFADKTPEEYRQMISLQKPNLPKVERTQTPLSTNNLKNLKAIDWRDEGAVLAVRDQGDCGSSWVFAAIGCLEGQNQIINKKSVLLSAQELIDCSVPFGAECHIGGEFVNGYLYVMDYGIVAEDDYPFVGDQHVCRVDNSKKVLDAHGYGYAFSERDLETNVSYVGPIATMINADCIQFYEGGIYSNTSCPNTEWDVNFGVLTVGYNTDSDGLDYWILKNSFGSDWGEEGYLRIQRGVNELGIGSHNVYSIINK